MTCQLARHVPHNARDGRNAIIYSTPTMTRRGSLVNERAIRTKTEPPSQILGQGPEGDATRWAGRACGDMVPMNKRADNLDAARASLGGLLSLLSPFTPPYRAATRMPTHVGRGKKVKERKKCV
jgi:hypothetical protein